MICSEFYKGEGLGNQLWKYVVTRINAQKSKTGFCILRQDRFRGKEFMDIDFGTPLSGGHASPGGYLFKLPTGIDQYYNERRELSGTALGDMLDDITRTDPLLLSLPDKTKLDGNCQSTRYLDGFKSSILKWITLKPSYSSYVTPADVCLIHLRFGDFMHSKVFLPKEYYVNAMRYVRSINPNVKFQCVTDQKEMAETFLPEVPVVGSALSPREDGQKAKHHFGGPIGIDFSLLKTAPYLILPNSSFSWWAAYLNTEKKVVVAPKYWARFNISDGFWSPSDIITDGFTYIDIAGNVFSSNECWEEKNTFEEAHQNDFMTAENLNINKLWKGNRFWIIYYVRFFLKKIIISLRRIF